jgi:hypothetical protein
MIEYVSVLSLFNKLAYLGILQFVIVDKELLSLLLPVEPALKNETVSHAVLFQLAKHSIEMLLIIVESSVLVLEAAGSVPQAFT